MLKPNGDITQLKALATVGAFHASGIGLVTAARLEKTISDEMRLGEIPTGLKFLATKLPSDAIRSIAWDDTGDEDFALHRTLSAHPGIYRRGTAIDGDLIIEIVDRELVFARSLNRHFKPQFFGRVVLKRGSDPIVEPVPLLLPRIDYNSATEADLTAYRLAGDRLEAEMLKRRERAVATITVNVSLAIRNALDRVAQARISRGAVS